jgi:queuosine precursor transporter
MEAKPAGEKRTYRWLPFITAVFVTTLIISNIIAVKIADFFGKDLPAAVILFPIAYIFGDILTEVYGFARARQVIWTGFFCNLLAVIAIWIGGLLPSASFWTAQPSYQAILGYTPRLLAASFIAYLIGEFLNSIVLAKLKIRTRGRFLWIRTITSTIIGEGADSAVFLTIAFVGNMPPNVLWMTIIYQWLFKVAFEIVATPVTYLIVNWLKRAESEDYYDRGTNFSPVSFKTGAD